MTLNEKMRICLEKIAVFFDSQPHISSIKDGLVMATPLTILGGIALVIANPPIPADMNMNSFLGQILQVWQNIATALSPYTSLVNNLTLGILSVYIVVAIAYLLAEKKGLNKLTTSIGALLVFIMVAGPVTNYDGTNAIPVSYLDAKGMFTAIIVACVTVEVTNFLIKHNVKIKLPDSVPPMVAAPFEALIPYGVNVLIFLVISGICQSAFQLSIPALIIQLLSPLVSASDTLWTAMLYAFLINGFWFLGLHGANIVAAIMNPFMLMNLTANAEAMSAGQRLPNVLTSNWNILACNFGGSGATIAIVIACLLVARSKYIRSIIKIGGFPTIFNISEPIVFGLPLMLNSYLLIPMICVPVLHSAITYICMSTNIVGRVFVNVPWTLPGPIAAFLATLDWKASVLWIILIVIDVLIYIPFIKMYDQSKLNEEKAETAKE